MAITKVLIVPKSTGSALGFEKSDYSAFHSRVDALKALGVETYIFNRMTGLIKFPDELGFISLRKSFSEPSLEVVVNSLKPSCKETSDFLSVLDESHEDFSHPGVTYLSNLDLPGIQSALEALIELGNSLLRSGSKTPVSRPSTPFRGVETEARVTSPLLKKEKAGESKSSRSCFSCC